MLPFIAHAIQNWLEWQNSKMEPDLHKRRYFINHCKNSPPADDQVIVDIQRIIYRQKYSRYVNVVVGNKCLWTSTEF